MQINCRKRILKFGQAIVQKNI